MASSPTQPVVPGSNGSFFSACRPLAWLLAGDDFTGFHLQGRADEILVWKAGQQYPLHRIQQPGTTVPLLAIELCFGEGASLTEGGLPERDVRLVSSNGQEASMCWGVTRLGAQPAAAESELYMLVTLAVCALNIAAMFVESVAFKATAGFVLPMPMLAVYVLHPTPPSSLWATCLRGRIFSIASGAALCPSSAAFMLSWQRT